MAWPRRSGPLLLQRPAKRVTPTSAAAAAAAAPRCLRSFSSSSSSSSKVRRYVSASDTRSNVGVSPPHRSPYQKLLQQLAEKRRGRSSSEQQAAAARDATATGDESTESTTAAPLAAAAASVAAVTNYATASPWEQLKAAFVLQQQQQAQALIAARGKQSAAAAAAAAGENMRGQRGQSPAAVVPSALKQQQQQEAALQQADGEQQQQRQQQQRQQQQPLLLRMQDAAVQQQKAQLVKRMWEGLRAHKPHLFEALLDELKARALPEDEVTLTLRLFGHIVRRQPSFEPAWEVVEEMKALGAHPTLIRFNQRLLLSLNELHHLNAWPESSTLRKTLRTAWLAAALCRNRRQRAITLKNQLLLSKASSNWPLLPAGVDSSALLSLQDLRALWVGATVDPLLPAAARAVLLQEQQQNRPAAEAAAAAAAAADPAAAAQPKALATTAAYVAAALSDKTLFAPTLSSQRQEAFMALSGCSGRDTRGSLKHLLTERGETGMLSHRSNGSSWDYFVSVPGLSRHRAAAAAAAAAASDAAVTAAPASTATSAAAVNHTSTPPADPPAAAVGQPPAAAAGPPTQAAAAAATAAEPAAPAEQSVPMEGDWVSSGFIFERGRLRLKPHLRRQSRKK
ncbi:hypothetical protein Esti_000653 [Eimeria stiedai]